MKSRWILFFFFIISALPVSNSHALIVTSNSDPELLINDLFGSGVSLTGTLGLTGSSNAAGFFSAGEASGLAFSQGIILTTGRATDAEGPNDADDTGTDHGLPGDPELEAVAGGMTFDATTLDFDFQSSGGTLVLEYIFASEEYTEFVGFGPTDVMGIFLDGVNLALLPGTGEPVSIQSVNESSNRQFFNNNRFDVPGAPTAFDLEYDGFTTAFSIATPVTAGTHNLRIALADAFDGTYDSAVFLRSGSLTVSSIPSPGTLMLGMLGGMAMGLVGRTRRGTTVGSHST